MRNYANEVREYNKWYLVITRQLALTRHLDIKRHKTCLGVELDFILWLNNVNPRFYRLWPPGNQSTKSQGSIG